MKGFIRSVLCLCLISTTLGLIGLRFKKPKNTCRPLELTICSYLGYNKTQTSPDVYLRRRNIDLIEYISVLQKTKCSKDVLFFMCMMYSPPCFEGFKGRVYPCRSVCETVRDSCLYLIRRFQHDWPSELNCMKLPDHNTGVCISPNSIIQKNRPDMAINTIEDASKERTPCPKCGPMKEIRRFKQFKKASYVIQAVYESRATTARGKTKMTFNVKGILKKGKVPMNLGKMIIWANSLCVCPNLEFEKSYYIIGSEDKRRKRLLFNKKVMVVPEDRYWQKKMKKWHKKFQRVLERREQQRLNKLRKRLMKPNVQ